MKMDKCITKNEITRRRIAEHCRTHPALAPEDLFKFLYQSAFGCEHLVSSPEAAIGYDGGRTPKAKKLLSAIQAIRDILVNTEEWKALPDYEFIYD